MSISDQSYLGVSAAAAAAAAAAAESPLMPTSQPMSSGSKGRKRGNDDNDDDGLGSDSEFSPNKTSATSSSSVPMQYQQSASSTGDNGLSPFQSSTKKRRADSSLGVLAKRFIQRIMMEEDGKVELTNLSDELGVPRRRIYDIVNILEGVDVARKEAMSNTITWTGPRVRCIRTEVEAPNPRDEMTEIERVWALRMELFDNEREIAKLRTASKELDQCINQAQLGVRNLLSETKGYAYVTKEDIIKLPLFKEQTVMAIKVCYLVYLLFCKSNNKTKFNYDCLT